MTFNPNQIEFVQYKGEKFPLNGQIIIKFLICWKFQNQQQWQL